VPTKQPKLEFPSAFLKSVLVVDNSELARKMMEIVLEPYADAILTASGCSEAVQVLGANRDIGLVLSGVVMTDGDGFELLERLAAFNDPKPRAIIISASTEGDAAQRAAELGAIGFLAKPASPGDILRLVKEHLRERAANPRAPRRRTRARALFEEPASDAPRQRSWLLHDVSVTGAFLETKTPVSLGTELDLTLDFDDTVLEIRARVVRLQDGTADLPAGVGVSFIGPDEGVVDLLQEHVAAAGHDAY
jgi:CheY-like chemotaxis protein